MNVSSPPFAVLFLCSANQCRSPLAAALARRRLSGSAVVVRSAGLLPGGWRVPEIGVRVAAEFGVDLSTHVSRRFDDELAADADLVLTMTRSQARDVVTSHPDSWPRVFTLKSFALWLGTQSVPSTGITRSWIDEAAAVRALPELLGSNRDDEVDDPMGGSLRRWRRVATEVREAVDRVVAVMPTTSPVIVAPGF